MDYNEFAQAFEIDDINEPDTIVVTTKITVHEQEGDRVLFMGSVVQALNFLNEKANDPAYEDTKLYVHRLDELAAIIERIEEYTVN